MSNLLFFFECDSMKASDIFAALAPHMPIIQNLRVETEVVVEAKPRRKRKKTTASTNTLVEGNGTDKRIHNMVHNGRSKVYKAIIEILTDNPNITTNEIGQKLIPYGIKGNSASPALSYMKRAGVVFYDGRKYSLPPITDKAE